jgi:CPA1 family monovalent cation:H+ antiporter
VGSENVFVLLFGVASVVALLARRLGAPYPIALVIAGLGLGAVGGITPPHLTRELLYAVFLPGLIFEAAFHLDARVLGGVVRTVLGLAVPGVVLATLLTGALVGLLAPSIAPAAGFGYAAAFVFATLISATDPIAVIALFKTMGAPDRLAAAVEAESLLNDGTAVLTFSIAVELVTGGQTSVAAGALHFVLGFLGGAVLGGLVGLFASRAFSIIDDPFVEITITTVAAYGAFAFAEHLGASGIVATTVAGVVCGNYGAVERMRPSTRIAVQSFWSYVAFALNSIVFLLLGFEARFGTLFASWRLICVAYFAVLLGRAGVVYGATALGRRSREAMPWSWAAILTWGGMRGALSMVLAFGIAIDFPGRETIIAVTVGVVTLSIVLQGLTSGWLLRRLSLTGSSRAVPATYDRALALLRDARVALAAAEDGSAAVDRQALLDMRAACQDELDGAGAILRDLRVVAEDAAVREERAQRRAELHAARESAAAAFREGVIDEPTFDARLAEIDEQLIALRLR